VLRFEWFFMGKSPPFFTNMDASSHERVRSLLRETAVKTILVVIEGTLARHASAFLIEPEAKVFELSIEFAELSFGASPCFHECLNFGFGSHGSWEVGLSLYTLRFRNY